MMPQNSPGMMPQDALQSLHPLREPPPVSWWPPAPGWWLLAGLALTLLLALAVWIWRRHQRNRYRRDAAKALSGLLGADLSDSGRVQQANALLKRAALAAYPHGSVAALGGSEWIRFLERTLPDTRQAFAGIDSDILYIPDPPPDMARAFVDAALVWVRHHRAETKDA